MTTRDELDLPVRERFRQGDPVAFDAVLTRYQGAVLNFCYRLLGQAAEAEDVAQEVFVRAHRHARHYDPGRALATWLFTLARHAAIDRLRWRARHPTEPLPDTEDRRLTATADVVAEVAGRELAREIAAAVGALPEDQRTAMVLSEYHGLPGDEIARVMGCSAKAIENRLYRARQTLRQQLRRFLE